MRDVRLNLVGISRPDKVEDDPLTYHVDLIKLKNTRVEINEMYFTSTFLPISVRSPVDHDLMKFLSRESLGMKFQRRNKSAPL